ncbi:phage capsid protein [Kitasatospora purpeofusca]|uniref:phage capsid protein n=1 Tax=Kitasatospora purpeofusca TaxID=67352 RepID=UPI002251C16D|nr:phage capsid protein [Kitasatospora purpeofusca]MCX4685466.1 phage capsid protein [Kitasatospora purpeofusca]
MAPITHHFNLDPKQVTIAALGLLDRQLTLGSLPARYSELNFTGGVGDVINVNRESRGIPVVAGGITAPITNPITGDKNVFAAASDRPLPSADRKAPTGFINESRFPVQLTTLAQNSTVLSMEQVAFDLRQFGSQVLSKLTRGFAEYFDDTTAAFIKANITRSGLTAGQKNAIGGDVAVTIPVADGTAATLSKRALNLRTALVDARLALNLANVPASERYLIAGPEIEAILLKDPEFVAVDYSGDTNALRRATIGRIYGFDIVIHNSFGLEMFLFHRSALFLVSACPAIPMGAVNGSIQNVNGIATRMLVDYDFNRKADTIGLDTMYGLATVKEDPDYSVRGTVIGEKFVRGLKISVTEQATP